MGLSQNECPKPSLKYTKIYKKDSTGYIDFIAEEEIIDYKNDIISLDLSVIREDTKSGLGGQVDYIY